MILPKVGVVTCSGTGLPEGTITRLAALRILEELRPRQTVTICLPLFLAGGKEDREFVRNHPTIVVDGCEKRCGERSVKQLRGRLVASIVLPRLARKDPWTMGDLGEEETRMVIELSEKIADTVDRVFEEMKKRPKRRR